MGYPIDEPKKGLSGAWCGLALVQAFVRPDGTGGTYCERPGFVDYRPFTAPAMTGGALPTVIRTSSGGATTGAMQPGPAMEMPASGGTWFCGLGVPTGLVATQYNVGGCGQ